MDILGYTWEEVDEEAEILEHAVTERLLGRIDKVLGHPRRDPHGDPIPAADGSVEDAQWVRLSAVDKGALARIERVSDEDPLILKEVIAQELLPGAEVFVAEHKTYAGVMQVVVNGKEKTIGDPVAAIFCAIT